MRAEPADGKLGIAHARHRPAHRVVDRLRIGVAGCGYWGERWLRVLQETPWCDLVAAADPVQARRDLIRRRHPATRPHADTRDMLASGELDAVVIATPTSTHYELAHLALEHGVHVMVTKPMCGTVGECELLAALAHRHGRVLAVDHTYVYTAAVRHLHRLYHGGDLGAMLYLDSVRVNLGLIQHDCDVIWDLLPHDVSIFRYVVGELPSEVLAVGSDPLGFGHASVAHVTLFWKDGLTAGVHLNWLSPVKVRRMLIGGSRLMVVYDDVEPTEKLRVYDTGASALRPDPSGATPTRVGDREGMLVDYRTGDMVAPKLDFREALAVEADEFIDVCRDGGTPRVGGDDGREVVRVLQAASESLRTGRRVKI